MTSTAEQTLTPPTDHPDQIGLGFAELAALFAVQPGPSTDATAAALGLADQLGNELVVSAGASSLVARGFATATPDDELEVSGPIAALAQALGHTERLVNLSLLTADSVDRLALIEAEGIGVLLQPRAFHTWWAMAQRPDLSASQAMLFVIRKHLEQNPDGGASVARPDDPQGRRLLVKRAAAGWTIGTYVPGTDAVDESPADDTSLLAAIDDVLRG